MSPETAILRDLLAGQSTADSIAPRVRLQTNAVLVILQRQQTEGTVISKPLSCLTVWMLAPATRQHLTAPANP